MLRIFLLGVALWNTVVAAINIAIASPEMMVYITPTSQLAPVVIPIALWALTYKPVREFVKKLF